MSLAEEQHQNLTHNAVGLRQALIPELLSEIVERRRWLAKVIGIGALIIVGVAVLIPNKYTSTAQLMPPDQASLSSTSMLNALSGSGLVLPSVGGGSLLSQRTAGQTAIGIMSSRTVQDDIINRFDLRKVYREKLYADTRTTLSNRTALDEDKKTGIVSIAVTDRNPSRARDIVQAYIEELDRLVNSLSTSSARREREFLEARLTSIKTELDTNSRALSQFSSRNAMFDPQKQGQATVEAAGKLQGELILAEGDLSSLKAVYADDNERVRAARARVAELQGELKKMGGEGAAADGADLKANELLPSVRQLPLLGYTYADLYRKVTMDEVIYETLTKQYELAKVQEAKDIPPVKVLDAPEVPEKKATPHRSIIISLGIAGLVCLSILWVIVSTLWRLADDSAPIKIYWRMIAVLFRRRNAGAMGPNSA